MLLYLLLSEAFAVVREAARRKLGMRHFDVQVPINLCNRVLFLFFIHVRICIYLFIFRSLVERCFMMGPLLR